MQQIGNIIKQINRKITMETETETFECSYKMSYPPKGGQSQYTIYVTKDNGIDMTIYGEVLGAERWDKGARLKVTAQPVKTSKSGKQYQTATSVELLEGEVAVPTGTVTNTHKDPDAQVAWHKRESDELKFLYEILNLHRKENTKMTIEFRTLDPWISDTENNYEAIA